MKNPNGIEIRPGLFIGNQAKLLLGNSAAGSPETFLLKMIRPIAMPRPP